MPDNGQVCHYLEAAPEDWETTLPWASPEHAYTKIVELANYMENNGYAVGEGRKYTALILAADPDALAAMACVEYRGGGKRDWFLPSRGEFNLLARNRDKIGDILPGEWYWTSTQNDAGTAGYNDVRGMENSQYAAEKSSNCYVRPVRSF
jgi:hypothetical protein